MKETISSHETLLKVPYRTGVSFFAKQALYKTSISFFVKQADNCIKNNSVKSFILENDNENIAKKDSIKNIIWLTIWHLFVIFLQNEACYGWRFLQNSSSYAWNIFV